MSNAAEIIADLLASTLMRGHEEGRRHLYIWEARGLAYLADNATGDISAWTGDRMRAYAAGMPVLPGWSLELYPIEWVRASARGEGDGGETVTGTSA